MIIARSEVLKRYKYADCHKFKDGTFGIRILNGTKWFYLSYGFTEEIAWDEAWQWKNYKQSKEGLL